MLSKEERQQARQFAETTSAGLSDAQRERCAYAAHEMIDVLRERFGSDDLAYGAAMYVAHVLSVIVVTPVGHAADLIDNSIQAYTLAAGQLAGVYELPPRDQQSGPAPSAGPSPYL